MASSPDLRAWGNASLFFMLINTAAIGDEAEQVLTEMHTALEDKFGVKMGEVLWQGKDPNRARPHAEQLPSGQRSRSRSL